MNHLFQPKKWIQFLNHQTWKDWIQWIIVFGVLLIGVILPLMGSQERLIQILMLIAGLTGLVVMLQWPPVGLIGILLGNYFVSYSGPGGVNIVVFGITAVTGLWIADMIIRQRRLYLAESRVTLAILFFFASTLLSFVVGQLPWQPLAPHAPLTAQVGGVVIFLISGFAFLIQGNMVNDLRWLKVFTWLFVAIGVLYIAARLSIEVEGLLDHVFADGAFRGSLFFVWILVIPFSQALLNNKLHLFWRVVLFVLTLGVLYVAVVQSNSWKSGYIPPLAGMVVIILLLLRRHAIWLVPFLIVGAWLVSREAIATDEYSVITRLEAWRIVFQLSSVAPLFGMGFGNYYWYTPLVSIRGWRVNFSSHSQYVDIFSQAGLIGLICFAWVFGEIARLGWQLRETAPEGFARAYVYGALGGLAGTLVAGLFADWVLPFVYNIGMNGLRSSILSWFFLGGLVVIRRIVDQKQVYKISNAPMGGNDE